MQVSLPSSYVSMVTGKNTNIQKGPPHGDPNVIQCTDAFQNLEIWWNETSSAPWINEPFIYILK